MKNDFMNQEINRKSEFMEQELNRITDLMNPENKKQFKLNRATMFGVVGLGVIIAAATTINGCSKKDKEEIVVEVENEEVTETTVSENEVKVEVEEIGINNQEVRMQTMTDFTADLISRGIYFNINDEEIFKQQLEFAYQNMIHLNMADIKVSTLYEIFSEGKFTYTELENNAKQFLDAMWLDMAIGRENVALDTLLFDEEQASIIKDLRLLVNAYINDETKENAEKVVDYLKEHFMQSIKVDSHVYQMATNYIYQFETIAVSDLTKEQKEVIETIKQTEADCEEKEVDTNSIYSDKTIISLEIGKEKFGVVLEMAIENDCPEGTYQAEIDAIYENIMEMIRTGELVPGKLNDYEELLNALRPQGGSTLPEGSKMINGSQYISGEIIAQYGSIEAYMKAVEEANKPTTTYTWTDEDNNDLSGKTDEQIQATIEDRDALKNQGYMDATTWDNSSNNWIQPKSSNEWYMKGYNEGMAARPKVNENPATPPKEEPEDEIVIIEEGPITPVVPVTPDVPVTPIEPVTPVQPEVPVTPVEPVLPETPVPPTVPIEPVEEDEEIIEVIEQGPLAMSENNLINILNAYREFITYASAPVYTADANRYGSLNVYGEEFSIITENQKRI